MCRCAQKTREIHLHPYTYKYIHVLRPIHTQADWAAPGHGPIRARHVSCTSGSQHPWKGHGDREIAEVCSDGGGVVLSLGKHACSKHGTCFYECVGGIIANRAGLGSGPGTARTPGVHTWVRILHRAPGRMSPFLGCPVNGGWWCHGNMSLGNWALGSVCPTVHISIPMGPRSSYNKEPFVCADSCSVQKN